MNTMQLVKNIQDRFQINAIYARIVFDMAKSDDALFRRLVEKKQKERWKLPITTDGYEIILKDNA